jgi:hypothetical protein
MEGRMADRRSLDGLQFAALLVLAVALVPGGAHLFELPNKIAMSPEQYMVVQSIYRGWELFGIPLLGAVALTLIHAIAVRTNGPAVRLSLGALFCLIANLAIFFAFTFPMNVATSNWTVMPTDFEAARRQWEYSHAVNAALMLAAFASLTLSVLASRRNRAV